jgi:hypothetical protein
MPADALTDTGLRDELAQRLAAGLETKWQQRAYDSDEIEKVLRQLRSLAPLDRTGRLIIAGFIPRPYLAAEEPELEQGCSTCMYFERNRQYCNLPELALPVRPEWSCVLWRI